MQIFGKGQKLIQTNRSDVWTQNNSMWDSFNLDLTSDVLALRVSPRIILNTNGLDGLPWGFRYFDGSIFAGAGSKIYKGGADAYTGFSEDVSSGAQTDYTADESDMEVFNATLVATTTDGVYSKASGAGAWTSRATLSTGGPHLLSYFKKFDRIYYTDLSSKIKSLSASWVEATSGDYYINLSTDSAAYTITSLKASSTHQWAGILDKTKEGQNGKIIQWDGISSQIDAEYKLNAQGCLALVIDEVADVPFAIDTLGRLLKFNRAGFEEVGRLPFSHKLLKIVNDTDNADRPIHPNGLRITKDRTVEVLVNNLNVDNTYNENFHAGIYEFVPKGDGTYSCHHKYSPSLYTVAGSSVKDYGQTQLAAVGALSSVNLYSTNANRNGTFMCGCTYYTDTTTTSSGIFYDDSNDTLQKTGYFITTKILADNIKQKWQSMPMILKKLLDSNDEIRIGYRTEDEDATDITITAWSGSNSVRTSSTVTDYGVGDSIFFTQCEGAGRLFQITEKTDLGGGVTEFTLDGSFTGLSGAGGKAKLQHWKKIWKITDQNIDSWDKTLVGLKDSALIQFIFYFVFKGKDQIYSISLENSKAQ